MQHIKRMLSTILGWMGLTIIRRDPSAKYGWLKFSVTIKDPNSKYRRIQSMHIDTVVDIGANKGQFLEEYLKVFPDAKFHSFEPLPKVFLQLEQKFGGRKNVYLYNIGLGAKDAILEMHQSVFDPSSSFLDMTDIHKKAFPYTASSHIEKTQVKKLDDIKIAGRNILIKIDTQGYEQEVINGGLSTIKKSKICIIEVSFYSLYKNQPLFADIYDAMLSLGFTYAGAYDQIIDPFNGALLQQDAIFIQNVQ